MRQSAQVIQVTSNGYAQVKVRRASACASAHNCGSCDHCSMMENAPEIVVNAANFCGAQVGDTVVVESETGKVLGAAVLLYLLPVLLFFVGYVLGNSLGWTESGAITTGGAGFVLGLFGAWCLDRYRRNRPVTYRIVSRGV